MIFYLVSMLCMRVHEKNFPESHLTAKGLDEETNAKVIQRILVIVCNENVWHQLTALKHLYNLPKPTPSCNFNDFWLANFSIYGTTFEEFGKAGYLYGI